MRPSLRFNVFKRDGFVCQYCGRSPPAVVLEVDHITARKNGGGDEIDNLLTSCFDCNRGKAANPLSAIPQSVADKAEILAEKEEQLREFDKLKKAVRRRKVKVIKALDAHFTGLFPKSEFTEKFYRDIERSFVDYLSADEMTDALDIAARKCPTDADRALRYFCGICWSKRREHEKPNG